MVDAGARLQAQMVASESELDSLEQIYGNQNVRVRAAEARVATLSAAELGRESLMEPTGSLVRNPTAIRFPIRHCVNCRLLQFNGQIYIGESGFRRRCMNFCQHNMRLLASKRPSPFRPSGLSTHQAGPKRNLRRNGSSSSSSQQFLRSYWLRSSSWRNVRMADDS